MGGDKRHWERRYEAQSPEAMSWFEADPATSLAFIERAGMTGRASIIDVGGGASTLVDHLLARDEYCVTVVDIAGAALNAAKARLGSLAEAVMWREADVLSAAFEPQSYDLWHDRAVFHFLTAAEDRARYVAQLTLALRPRGQLVLSAFAEDGPLRCSDLDVVRYASGKLATALGPQFTLCEELRVGHRTPSGATQSFIYTRWTRSSK